MANANLGNPQHPTMNNTAYITLVPNEIILKILELVNPSDEFTLIKTNRYFKNVILLCKYPKKTFSFVPSMNGWLFDIVAHNFPCILQSQYIHERLRFLLGEFQSILTVHNVVLAGGSLVLALDPMVSEENILNSKTDLDFFIYGDHNEKSDTLKNIKEILDPYGPLYNCRGNVIDVLIKGKRMIQLIISDNRTYHPYQVVNQFDLSYVQFFYDGKRIYGTNVAVFALMSRIVVVNSSMKQIRKDRWEKTLAKGFDITLEPTTMEMVNPEPITIKNKYFISCVKRDLDRDELSEDLLDSFDKTINVEDYMTRIKSWKLMYGGMNGAGCCDYKHFLKDVRFEVDEGRECYRLKEYRLMKDGNEIEIRSCHLIVANVMTTEYGERFSVLESDFSRCRKEIIDVLAEKGFPVTQRERTYENEWLNFPNVKNVPILDIFENVVGRRLRVGDAIIVEVTPRYYKERPLNRRQPINTTKAYLSFRVKRIILL